MNLSRKELNAHAGQIGQSAPDTVDHFKGVIARGVIWSFYSGGD